MTNSHHDFSKVANRKKTPAPFSLRLTFEERAKLEEAANGVPLGAYIRARLFDEDLPKVRRRGTRPVADHAALAKVLAGLGSSRLSSNLNQLAKVVNSGIRDPFSIHKQIEEVKAVLQYLKSNITKNDR